jgi:hypothetical protein
MTDKSQTTKLGHPRIFVEVIREVEGGGALRVRREIDLAVFSQARISVADIAVNECLAEMSQYGRLDAAPSPIQYAIGDLGPARRHISRLISGQMTVSPMLLREISASLERCVTRLEAIDKDAETHG